MNQKSAPDLFENLHPAVPEILEPGDGKQMAWLAALALMAIVAGATLALLVDDTPSEAAQVTVLR